MEYSVPLYPDQIYQLAGQFAAALRTAPACSMSELRTLLGHRIVLDHRDSILFEVRPSHGKSSAITASYTRAGVGTPLELRFNPQFNYGAVCAISNRLIDQFMPCSYDSMMNIVQEHTFLGTPDPTILIGELDRLYAHTKK